MREPSDVIDAIFVHVNTFWADISLTTCVEFTVVEKEFVDATWTLVDATEPLW